MQVFIAQIRELGTDDTFGVIGTATTREGAIDSAIESYTEVFEDDGDDVKETIASDMAVIKEKLMEKDHVYEFDMEYEGRVVTDEVRGA